MSATQYNFVATCSIGCETILEKELKSLGFSHVKAARNLVRFSGGIEDGMRACLWSRCASRILMSLDSVHAPSAEEIYRQCLKVPWEDFLSASSTFAVHGIGTNRSVRNSAFLAQKVKDAIADRLRNRYGKRPNVDRNDPQVSINAHLAGARLDLSLDLSGDSLHKRGWRVETTQAPIKESLAATILLAAGYKGDRPFSRSDVRLGYVSCGSGGHRLGASAGSSSPFCVRTLADVAQNVGKTFRREPPGIGKAEKTKTFHPFWAVISNDRAIRITSQHIEQSGLSEIIHVEKMGAVRARFPEEDCLLATNPPYGERIKPEDDEDLTVLYRKLGEKWKDIGRGRLAVICAHTGFRKSFRAKAVSGGGIVQRSDTKSFVLVSSW